MAAYLVSAFRKKESLGKAAFYLAAFGALLHLADLGLRAYIGRVSHNLPHYVPWSNWFESFSLFAFAIAVTFIGVQRMTRLSILGAFVMTLQWIIVTFSMTYPLFGSWDQVAGASQAWQAVMASRAIPQLMPALQSIWMAIHVPVMFTSYSAFAVAFAVGIVYLIQERELKSKHPGELSDSLPALEILDLMIYRLIGWGFPLLTLGVILGARWAYDAWGRYWGWDAKETWALITWFTYAIYLHMRLVMSWRGRKTVLLSIFAFGVVLFTYIGVNYLSELHGFLSNRGS
ncbi:MAG: c-type cytochrome biogenesis protein CcsB [Elusimicrobia bacterium RIFCSPLOWO2_01_FULL_60_11]|nr:MAG: c-type cytochrome biogenesis protein CcsB [Elusimicrobia bacterium RIFCSPLOWO2_01_FULL_60_11]